MNAMDVHAWMRPRLAALFAEARAAGIAHDVAVAVVTDVVNGAGFAPAVPPPDEQWNRDIGEPDGAVNADATHAPEIGGAASGLAGIPPLPRSRRF